VFLNAEPGFKMHHAVEEFILRNLTPPYLSNRADVQHVDLQSRKAVLLMCSDGLMDLYDGDYGRDIPGFDLNELATKWFKTIRLGIEQGTENCALHLLREALGRGDDDKLAQMLTVEVPERWMDDSTLLVQSLHM
jgi:pyruvate dehydrogenase phosphatase